MKYREQKVARRAEKPFNIWWRGLTVLAALTLAIAPAQAKKFTAPAAPQIRPLISRSYSTDKNKSRIDDKLEEKAQKARLAKAKASTTSETESARASLAEKVKVELIFEAPVTQAQIDAFVAAGGEITYVYQTISYGWNGRIALDQVETLPGLLGAELLLISEPIAAQATLNIATRAGRVRPIWAPGFAGSTAGYDGDPSITIAILDTGVDGTHTDLSGRQAFWCDYTDEGLTTSMDLGEHGSHVTGIALGSGASGGSTTSTLYYTDTGWLPFTRDNVTAPIDIPTDSCVFSSVADWWGDAVRFTIYGVATGGQSGSWSAPFGYAAQPPMSASMTLTPNPDYVYRLRLVSEGGMGFFRIANSVTNYPGLGDGFNKFRGVAPGCNWAGARVLDSSGHGTADWIGAALDDLVSRRVQNNIKVMNLSLSFGGEYIPIRQKINSTVQNGILVVCAAGNNGAISEDSDRQINDPGRAAMAITVAACNDINQVTHYSSVGFSNPSPFDNRKEDYKPDLTAPGGSHEYYGGILSIDGNTVDAEDADMQANDYRSICGTSMASPFVAGCAALVIDALQQNGVTWNYYSPGYPLYVKGLLCATASETGLVREDGTTAPAVQRAAPGPDGFPAGKDRDEGFGMINPDAAIEAATLTIGVGSTENGVLGNGIDAKRVWARNLWVNETDDPLAVTMTVPGTGDFDLYLYAATPNDCGVPWLLASSTKAGNGGTESLMFPPEFSESLVLVVKRVSGYGPFSLTTSSSPVVLFARTAQSGSESVSLVEVPVLLGYPAFVNVTVNCTYSGTASRGTRGDYTAPSTITFSPGEIMQAIPITVRNDSNWEPNETIIVNLSSPFGAVLGSPSQFTYTIEDNDPPANDAPSGAALVNTIRDPNNAAVVSGQLLTNATTSNYTPSCAGAQLPDVWYYVPVFPGMQLNVTNQTPGPSCIAMWTGPSAGNLTQRACAWRNQGGPTTSISYQTVAGDSQVWVQLTGNTTANAYVNFSLYQNCNEPGTTKNVCPYAEWLSGAGSIVGPLTIGATASPGEPYGLTVPDVWYRITPDMEHPGMIVSYDDKGSANNSGFVSIYRGWPSQLYLREYSCSRNEEGKFRVGINAGQGEQLYIRIGSTSTATNQQLDVTFFDKTNP